MSNVSVWGVDHGEDVSKAFGLRALRKPKIPASSAKLRQMGDRVPDFLAPTGKANPKTDPGYTRRQAGAAATWNNALRRK